MDRSGIHVSIKPEPVLKHFFRMLVDEHTRLLDPTCGSGTALRAAEGLGAKNSLGIEADAEFADRAREALIRARTLRAVA
jgi:DNA modification methylase